MAAGNFKEKEFLGNFLGKLPGGQERQSIELSGELDILEDMVWKDDNLCSQLLRGQKVREFYGAIDNAIVKLDISEYQIREALLGFDNGDVAQARKVVFPLVKYLHNQGYNIVDLTGRHAA